MLAAPINSLCLTIALVDQNKQSYFDATSRHEKIHIAHQVVVAIRQMGRFLKYDDHREGWVVVPEATARQKVCQALQYRRRQGEAAAQMEAMASTAPVNTVTATAAGAPVNPSAAAAAAAASVAFAATSAQNQALHSLQIDPYAQLSQLYPHVAAAAAVAAATAAVSRANGRANGAAEAKQGESPDSDYASLIRALSRGAHNGSNNGSA